MLQCWCSSTRGSVGDTRIQLDDVKKRLRCSPSPVIGRPDYCGIFLEKWNGVSPFAVLRLFYWNKNSNFIKHFLQHANDFDFVQVTADWLELNLNPKRVLTSFKGRVRHNKLIFGQQIFEFDCLRFSSTVSNFDSNLQAFDYKVPKTKKGVGGIQLSVQGAIWSSAGRTGYCAFTEISK